jgi:nucleoside-diphosphate-sugar epimerase
MKPKVALITGINGFMGKNLVNHLKKKNVMSVGVPRELLQDVTSLEKYIKEINPNYIYHLAAYGNHHNQEEFDQIIITNLIGTYAMLRASLEVDYEAFINVSTSSVYGKKNAVMREKDTLEADNFYSCTKVGAEYLSRAFAKKLNKNIVNVRPFSVYGEHERDDRLIPTIVRNLVNNKPVDLIEPPKHDWIYIEDFLTAIDTLIANISKVRGDSINIGTGRQRTNREVYDLISDITRYKTKVRITKTGRDYESPRWQADITTMKLFGWKPKYSLERGLVKTVQHFQAKYEQNAIKPETLSTIMETTLGQFGVKFEDIDEKPFG